MAMVFAALTATWFVLMRGESEPYGSSWMFSIVERMGWSIGVLPLVANAFLFVWWNKVDKFKASYNEAAYSDYEQYPQLGFFTFPTVAIVMSAFGLILHALAIWLFWVILGDILVLMVQSMTFGLPLLTVIVYVWSWRWRPDPDEL